MKEGRADKITTNPEEKATEPQSEKGSLKSGQNHHEAAVSKKGTAADDSAMDDSISEDSFFEDSSGEAIMISVSTEFLPEQSETAKSLFAFSYTIRIVNEGKTTAQLLNRHWRVFSGGKQIADVKGEGVVGEQPILQPGEAFEYESGTLLHDPIGAMSGSYTFVDEYGTFFDVPVEEFSFLHIDDLTVH
jgi:ApaG protein